VASVQRVTILLLARHGETDWNRELRFQGHADPPLNEAGRRQALALAAAVVAEEPTGVYASDLRRARETAEIVASALGLTVVADRRLREIDVGSWEGRTRVEVDGADWDGESLAAHRARVLAALREIAVRHPGQRVLVVAHGGTLRRAQEAALGEALPVVENCGLWVVAVEDGRFRPVD